MTLEAALTIAIPALASQRIGELPRLWLDYNSALLINNVSKSVCSDVLAKVQAEQQSLLQARLQIIRRRTSIV